MHAPGGGIDEQFLIERPADAHAHAAVHLRRGERGIDDHPGVVHVQDVRDADLAQIDIHFHFGKAAAEGGGILARLEGCLCGELSAAILVVERIHRQIVQRDHDAFGVADKDYGIALRGRRDGQGGGRVPGHFGGIAEELPAQPVRDGVHGGGAGVGLAGGVGPGIPRRDVRVLRGDDVDVFISDAERFRNHLGKGGVRALSDFRRPGHEVHRAVLIQDEAGAARFHIGGIGPRTIAERGHADPAPQRAARADGFFIEGFTGGLAFVPPELFAAFLKAVADAERGDRLAVERRDVAVAPGVLQAEIQRVHVERAGRIVHEAFDGIGGLGRAVTPAGPAYGDIAVKGLG